MRLGVFIPIGNNGWLISTTSPRRGSGFGRDKAIVPNMEQFGIRILPLMRCRDALRRAA